MLTSIAENLWHVQYVFKVRGVPASSRMTVLRLANGALWIHSPVPIDTDTKKALDALGEVRFIVAPSKVHHTFLAEFAAHFPTAAIYGAPGLAQMRPDLTSLQPLTSEPGDWAPELVYLLFQGIPLVNETIWFHPSSKTLIVTDLCQWCQGDLPWKARLWVYLSGVRKRLSVPITMRVAVRDKEAAAASAERLLQWPVRRIVMAHNSIIEADAHAHLERALGRFTGR